jgi:lipoprotein signal peptidase
VTKGQAFWILPIVVGLLFPFFFSKKYFWVYRIPMSIVVGTGVGIAISGTIRAQFIDQIVGTIAPVSSKADIWSSGSHPLNALLIALGTVGTLFFFIFTKEQKGPWLYASHIGRWVMMIAFGAAFGFTVMARMSLLIGRMQFLLDPSSVAWYVIPVAILVVAAVALMDRTKGSKS